MRRIILLLAVCAAAGWRVDLAAQSPPSAIQAERSEQPATFTYFNRPIAVLRARVLGRSATERAEVAVRAIDDLVQRWQMGPVSRRPIEGGWLISVGSRGVLVLTSADVDELSGETVTDAAAAAAARLQSVLNEVDEARTPMAVLRGSIAAAAMIVFAALLLWGITRARHAITQRLLGIAERTVARTGLADVDVLRSSKFPAVERGIVAALASVADLLVIYAAVGFVLRRFPYTRPWGESMRGFLVATAKTVGLGIAGAIPGLFTALVIFFIARFAVRLIGVWFDAIEHGRLTPRWIYPETAQPTRRLLTALVWIFAMVVAYPYLPGSQTDAFKGVSVFLGLIVTFGSSGLVNQIMSGFVITYSRALRIGDFVRIADVEGTVVDLGVLSTKVKTVRKEEVTIPNAVVISQTTTDYTRFGAAEGVLTPTSVTIGYDTPWRQVHALMLLAAERTAGLGREPKPLVVQEALEDFYVKYTLLVGLEQQELRLYTLDALHANIQDVFNEYGVQIMSPNYVIDPAAPKVVQKENWFAAPARPAP